MHTTPEERESWKNLDARATPGPWEWRHIGHGVPVLIHPGNGLDAVRKGMQGAVVRVAVRESPTDGGIMFPIDQLLGGNYNPDMVLLAVMRDAFSRLLKDVDGQPTQDLDTVKCESCHRNTNPRDMEDNKDFEGYGKICVWCAKLDSLEAQIKVLRGG